MTSKFLGVLAAVPMFAFATMAAAEEAKPVVLDAQALDNVTAGVEFSAFFEAFADAVGGNLAVTNIFGSTEILSLDTIDTAAGSLTFGGVLSTGFAEATAD
jgi:hypothetical protein